MNDKTQKKQKIFRRLLFSTLLLPWNLFIIVIVNYFGTTTRSTLLLVLLVVDIVYLSLWLLLAPKHLYFR